MKLLEHEAKTLLRSHAIPVPRGTLIIKNTKSVIKTPVVLKSQVPVGGRGKVGGVVVVESASQIQSTIDRLFALEIKGHTPKTILAEVKLAITREYYLSLLVDYPTATIRLIAHKNGGVEVEDNESADFFNQPIDQNNIAEQSQALAKYLELDTATIRPLVTNLYAAFIQNDAMLLEINPLVLTKSGQLVCGDCKMELDDMAGFRHHEWNFENMPSDANFVTLDPSGTVATIANGAGLAMATVDAVAGTGMRPANFLDIGGGATSDSVLRAFQKIVTFPNVQAIVVNIFAGITRCDQVALAIIQAKKQLNDLPPLFIRLAGTNFDQAVALLSAEDITTLATLQECLAAAKEAVNA